MLILQQLKEAFRYSRSFSLDSEKRYLSEIEAVGRVDASGQIYRHFDVLNSKASGLLAHISIMIAVTAFLLGSFLSRDTPIDAISMILFVELAIYALLTIPILSVNFITNPDTIYRTHPMGSNEDVEIFEAYLNAFARRRANFYFAFWCTMLANIVFVITVILKALLLLSEQ